ncbi:glycosyltransferase family 2 protein [Fuchsiella alkaliacetigena]|uniref:glycosyltransferase family 2 protein n=1 Tax=Fuchsiella alkaliacetigena TaxID=957042 RepID=UPI00200B57E9|nr:glycosyltransferase family 2 protein [Fuchsiella alkaliacetigena]MCK8824744.1 glycosyltransferase family 2 protein [Fuchsiella alkaliacetigena]
MTEEITALLPAYNEEQRIGTTISTLQEIPEVDKIIVINDGSTDNTAEVVAQTGVKLLNLQSNQGKGGALTVGIEVVDSDLICLLDADLGSSVEELTKLLKPVRQGEADMSIAKLPQPETKGGFGLVTNLARWGIKYFTGFEALAPLSGQRVLTKEVLKQIKGFAPGFGVETELTIKALQGGFKVVEVPVQMKHRETGRDWAGFKHRGRQFKDVLAVLYREFRGE